MSRLQPAGPRVLSSPRGCRFSLVAVNCMVSRREPRALSWGCSLGAARWGQTPQPPWAPAASPAPSSYPGGGWGCLVKVPPGPLPLCWAPIVVGKGAGSPAAVPCVLPGSGQLFLLWCSPFLLPPRLCSLLLLSWELLAVGRLGMVQAPGSPSAQAGSTMLLTSAPRGEFGPEAPERRP